PPMSDAPSRGDDECQPSGLAAQHWFAQRSFMPPVRDQGGRGTCWAHAAVGALETRDRIQRDVASDLSEQFLINRYKLQWDPAEYVDAGNYIVALDYAVSLGFAIPDESAWLYNKAWYVEPTDDRPYQGTCLDYDGFCSETAHESPI